MLSSSFKVAIALGLSLTFTASAANAATHEILIVQGGYFPAVTYAQAGDQIIFQNQSESSHTIQGDGASWTSGVIPPDGTFSLMINADTALKFSGNGTEALGEISFDPAPLN